MTWRRTYEEGASALSLLLKDENLHFFSSSLSPLLFHWCCESSPSCFRFCMSIGKTPTNHHHKAPNYSDNRRTLLHSAAFFQRAATFGIKMGISGIAGTQSFPCGT